MRPDLRASMVRWLHRGAPGRIGAFRRIQVMASPPVPRSTPPFWYTAAPLLLQAAVAWLQLLGPEAIAGTHEATQFSVPAGTPDENMQAGADFARELYPNVDVSFWDSESGSLSASRVEDGQVNCVVRASPQTGEALKPLGRFL